uniref:INVERT_DEFENSINS domain-containing protein n=1 Tax=Heterorhabditis bacteriophora TaxID=37862 RepID=A0A1I7XHE9_HETBA
MQCNVLVTVIVLATIAIMFDDILAREENFDESYGKVESGQEGRIVHNQELFGEETEGHGLENHPRSRQKRILCNKITGDRLCFIPQFSWRCKCGVAGCYNGKCTCRRCG